MPGPEFDLCPGGCPHLDAQRGQHYCMAYRRTLQTVSGSDHVKLPQCVVADRMAEKGAPV
jgi:hypothetical protein